MSTFGEARAALDAAEAAFAVAYRRVADACERTSDTHADDARKCIREIEQAFSMLGRAVREGAREERMLKR